jgi:uncharacterized delta-60 repeat protein
MFEVYGPLIRAQLQLSATDLTPTATGLIYFNTATKVVKWYDGVSSWKTAVDTDTQQTLSNKTLVAPVVQSDLNLSNNASVKLFEASANGTHKVTIAAPALLPADYNWTLPSAQGTAGSYLENNGSGGLSWTPATGVAFDPTALSDVLATKLGYKTYLTGTAYNGGVVPLVSSTIDGNPDAEFIPYQAQNGGWRLRGNIFSTSKNNFNATDGTGTGANAEVSVVVQQPDGKILLGGKFTSFNSVSGRNKLIRLNSNGSVDAAFQANIGTGAGTASGLDVHSIVLLSNGKIVVTGSFTTWNGAARPNGVICLNKDGTEDATFASNFSAQVSCNGIRKRAVLLSSGKLIVFGYNLLISSVNYNFIRINSDGSVDSSFNKGTITGGWAGVDENESIFDLKEDSSGNLYVFSGGTSITTGNGSNSINTSGLHHGIAKVDANNLNLDTTFRTNFSASTTNANFLADNYNQGNTLCITGSKIVFDYLTTIYSVSFSGVVSGTDIQTIGATTGVFDIKAQSDGKFLVGGNFTTIGGVAGRNRLARLNSNLTVDTTFSTNLGTGVSSDFVYSIAVVSYTDGIVIGGGFTAVNGVSKNRVIKILPTGVVQPISGALSTYTDTITGVTFNSAGNQAVTASISTTAGAALACFSQTVANTGQIITTSTAAYGFLGTSFDVELNSKPTWAY